MKYIIFLRLNISFISISLTLLPHPTYQDNPDSCNSRSPQSNRDQQECKRSLCLGNRLNRLDFPYLQNKNMV